MYDVSTTTPTCLSGKDERRVSVVVAQVYVDVIERCKHLQNGHEAVCACVAQASLQHTMINMYMYVYATSLRTVVHSINQLVFSSKRTRTATAPAPAPPLPPLAHYWQRSAMAAAPHECAYMLILFLVQCRYRPLCFVLMTTSTCILLLGWVPVPNLVVILVHKVVLLS